MLQERIQKQAEQYRENLVTHIQELIRIPSLKGPAAPGQPFGAEPARALEQALTIGAELGFVTNNKEGYVGTIDYFTNAPAGLDILAHLDVVPAPAEDWTVCPPFAPIVKDGKLYGRGSSDDKGPAIAALYAMKLVKDLGVPLQKNVRLILGTDEESGGEDIAYYYKDHPPAPCTFSPDSDFPVVNIEKGRINGEINIGYTAPNGAHIVALHCGIRPNVIPDEATVILGDTTLVELEPIIAQWNETHSPTTALLTQEGEHVELTVKGMGGHAAFPETANNALTALIHITSLLPLAASRQVEAIKGLAALFPHGEWKGNALGVAAEDTLSAYTTVSLNNLDMDETSLTAAFDARVTVSQSLEDFITRATQACAAYQLPLTIVKQCNNHHIPGDSPFVQTLLRAYEDFSQNTGSTGYTGGGTYVHGLPNAVAFGATFPGVETNIHGANEFAIIDDLLLTVQIFAKVIIDLCSGE